MILVFEMSWAGTIHAPGNSATLQIVARAWPGQEVRMHADPTHLRELRGDPALMSLSNLRLSPITRSPLCRGRPADVALRRLRHEFRTVRDGLRGVPPGKDALVLLISTTATGPFAAAWAARVWQARSGRRAAVQVCFHGNLNDALGWRSRNPLIRALDTHSALTARYPVPLRFLVLEQAIRDALSTLIPTAAARADVMPLPINTAEVPDGDGPALSPPVRFGFVGLGTRSKGMDTFLDIAARLRARHGSRIEFIHVGVPGPGLDPIAYAPLAHPPATDALPRAEFAARLGSLHYVVLPFRRGYYDLSASGALLDAVTWRKPVITTRVPLTAQFFDAYGDIGHLGGDETGLEEAMEAVMAEWDKDRYREQVESMRGAAGNRAVTALSDRYRDVIRQGFPGLLHQGDDRPRPAGRVTLPGVDTAREGILPDTAARSSGTSATG